jgi:hypothetical protein
LNWRDIAEKNVPMLTRLFVKLSKAKLFIPYMFNIEDLQSYLKATVPPLTTEEYQFFENNDVIRFYEDDMKEPVVRVDPKPGEPGLLFHEFVFLLARIAITNVTTSSSVSGKLNDFFKEKLKFNEVIDIHRARITYDDIIRRLEGGGESDLGSEEEGGSGEEWDSEELEMDENQRKLMEFLAKKAEEEKDFIIDYDAIITELEGILPGIPGRPEVEQINPPPYKLPRILFGKLMPKKDDEDDKKKKKKQAKKAPARKKDEPPPKPIKWADAPGLPEPVTLDLIRQARKDIVENIFPSNIRGEMCNSGVAPCIIKEVYYPPDAPHPIATLIESAIVYQNTGYFEQAIDCFEKGRQ